jgi:hypothetical protein
MVCNQAIHFILIFFLPGATWNPQTKTGFLCHFFPLWMYVCTWIYVCFCSFLMWAGRANICKRICKCLIDFFLNLLSVKVMNWSKMILIIWTCHQKILNLFFFLLELFIVSKKKKKQSWNVNLPPFKILKMNFSCLFQDHRQGPLWLSPALPSLEFNFPQISFKVAF